MPSEDRTRENAPPPSEPPESAPRTEICLRAFEATDQDAAAALINAGLGERFGFTDPSMNPDLFDIAASFAAGIFLVAFDEQTLVGTGALLPVGDATGQIQRMHTKASHRGRGIGSAVLAALEQQAIALGHERLVLETNVDWPDAIRFYAGHGYRPTAVSNGEQHFEKSLPGTTA